MKICFVTNTLTSGGAERVACLLANAWVALGHDVVILVTYAGHRKVEYTLDPSVAVRFIGDKSNQPAKGHRAWPLRLMALRNSIRDEDPGLVVSFLTNVNVTVLIATLGLNLAVIVSERAYPPLTPIPYVLNLARRVLYPLADHVVMQTQDGLEWLAYAIPRSRGAVIANPIRMPLDQSTNGHSPQDVVSNDDCLILAVGRLGPEKQFEKVIAAFACLAPRNPAARLVIVGEGPLRGELQGLITAMGLDDRISLPGKTERMHDWYERADCFSMTSSTEGYPNALLEAVCYGIPCLALDCKTGPREILKDIEASILLPEDASAETIAEGLTLLLTQRSEGQTSEADTIASRNAPEKIATQWLRLAPQADQKDIGA